MAMSGQGCLPISATDPRRRDRTNPGAAFAPAERTRARPPGPRGKTVNAISHVHESLYSIMRVAGRSVADAWNETTWKRVTLVSREDQATSLSLLKMATRI